MASDKSYLDYILDQLSDLEDVRFRAMMGEYILYYHGKIVGGIYDNRLLLKPVKAACDLMPFAARVSPYDGAKEMLLAERVDERGFLQELFRKMLPELTDNKKSEGRTAGKNKV